MFLPQLTPRQLQSRDEMRSFRQKLDALARPDTGIVLQKNVRGWRPSQGPRPVEPRQKAVPEIVPVPVVETRIEEPEASTVPAAAPLTIDDVELSFLRSPLSMDFICRVVARFYDKQVCDIRSETRKNGIVLPRQVAMYLIDTMLKRTHVAIGYFFGGRDHSTAHHGVFKIKWKIGERDLVPPATKRRLLQIDGWGIDMALQADIKKLKALIEERWQKEMTACAPLPEESPDSFEDTERSLNEIPAP